MPESIKNNHISVHIKNTLSKVGFICKKYQSSSFFLLKVHVVKGDFDDYAWPEQKVVNSFFKFRNSIMPKFPTQLDNESLTELFSLPFFRLQWDSSR